MYQQGNLKSSYSHTAFANDDPALVGVAYIGYVGQRVDVYDPNNVNAQSVILIDPSCTGIDPMTLKTPVQ